MNSTKTARFAVGAVLLGLVLSVGCQKKQAAPAACGSSVAGGAASDANAGSAAVAANAGGNSAGGSVNIASGGIGAAAATGGSDGTGAAAATGGADSVGGTGGTAGASPNLAACSQLAVADCATGMDCQALSGQPISGNPLCLGPFAIVACSSSSVACSPVATRATDLSGKDWVFPSTCIPSGWANSTTSGTRFDACTPPPSNADAGTN
jgi:hypothetical protein